MPAGFAPARPPPPTTGSQPKTALAASGCCVLTDVATNYFTLVGALRQLETVRAISAAQDETLRLVTARQRVGLASAFDVERARTDASSARAAIPPLETLVATSRHRIAVLIGDQASNATAAVAPWSGTAVVPEVQPGQPATLLERRPDLLASRAQLEAANWRRREAAAEWFPRLFVSALFGRQDVETNGIDLGAARFTNASALLTMPIFNWGRTRAINEVSESRQREALLSYEDAIVRALEDVENALVALRDERHRAEALQSAADSADAALARAQSLYDRGQIDLLPLLDAQRTRLTVRIDANDSSTQLLLDSVQLYKALGGGWEAFEPATPRENRLESTLRLIRSRGNRRFAARRVRITRAGRGALRPVRTVEVRYDDALDTSRYFGSVQARRETEQAFRVGGKVMERRVDVGQTVHEGDVLAVLDDVDYRLTEQATRQQLEAATARARQAESDAARLEALKLDGSVSASDEEHAQSELRTSRADAEAEARRLALARNQVKYTVLTRVEQRCRDESATRGRAGRRRGAASDRHRNRGRARDRRRRAGGASRCLQERPVQRVARERPRRPIRSRSAGAVGAGDCADPDLSRPPEARDTARPFARSDGDARRRACLIRPGTLP